MDKRTIDGKKFTELKTFEEKQLFLLEGIYDSNQEVVKLKYEFGSLKRHLKFIIQLQIAQLSLQNKNRQWTESYIKTLEKEASYL